MIDNLNKFLNGGWTYSQETDYKYMSKLSNTSLNLDTLTIGEIATGVLNDDEMSMKVLEDIVLKTISSVKVDVPNSCRRNIHVHFDKNILGKNLEYLKPLLMVMRAYENIIYRMTSAETGNPPKKGISSIISKTLGEDDVSAILRKYDGKNLDIPTWHTARHYGLNLFNIDTYWQAKGNIPGIIFRKDQILHTQSARQFLEEGKLTLDINSIEENWHVVKSIPPTFEFRLTPFTDRIEYLEQILLIYNIIIGMAKNMESNSTLKSRVIARNKLMDLKGSEIFDVPFDSDGIHDMIDWLPAEKKQLAKNLLCGYVFSKPLTKLDREPNIALDER